ncbi:uncharacterized protein BO80DRAFT_240368 [Aspergillus ibericus CBS 121593]|uniref:Uncharacterized protein n=1 Tax=Aspergillus ibericus CBS 121593 TaxID=1448316 RepID=A0A395GLC5_9EURO|nr:hypothetical protein BO80DRAFT_240368 [Aspergillus ibericus CBS 121593]RAK96194.1 hypothetical protein BO80DRAFT_240368 [Aspergillus ibericus CBS 121593]
MTTSTPASTSTQPAQTTSTITLTSSQSSQPQPQSQSTTDDSTVTWEHLEHAPASPKCTDHSIEQVSRLPGGGNHRDTAAATTAIDSGMQHHDVPVSRNAPAISVFPPSATRDER